MNRLSMRMTLAAGAMLVCQSAPAQDKPAADLDVFFKTFETKRAHVRSFEAAFKQRVRTEGEDDLICSGDILYAKPRRLIFRFKEQAVAYLIDERFAYQYDKANEQLQVMRLSDSPDSEGLFLGFEHDTQKLRKAYAVSLFDTFDEPDSQGLLLKPRQGGEDAVFQEAHLYLRAKDFLPYRILIINDEDSRVTYTLDTIKVNKLSDPAKTQIQVPENTVVVKDGRYSETVGPGGLAVPEHPVKLSVEPTPKPKTKSEAP